jgi:hypothetical protein
MGEVGDKFVIDLEACELLVERAVRGRAGRATPDCALFECWSSVANRVLCVDRGLSGDLPRPDPVARVDIPARCVLTVC